MNMTGLGVVQVKWCSIVKDADLRNSDAQWVFVVVIA